MKIEAIKLSKMHSGHLCLELSDNISWESFPAYVADILKYIGGKVIDKNDAPDMRVWDIEIGAHKIRIVYEDYPQMVSIESNSQSGDTLVKKLFELFKAEFSS